MKLYPITFRPLYKERIWGGYLMREGLSKDIPPDQPIGESWELVDREDNNSIIMNGVLAGRSLRDLLLHDRMAVMGEELTARYPAGFPLLIKFIQASDDLSIQVHPDDEMARKLENDSGKTEFWYIIGTHSDTIINYGLRPDITLIDAESMIRKGRIKDILQFYPVQAGDSLFIPAGCVHAIMKGTLLAEIQQNSDVTYRLYDWDRLGLDGQPRPLHLEKGIAAIRLSPELKIKHATDPCPCLANCAYFSIHKILLDRGESLDLNLDAPVVLMILRGKGQVDSEWFHLGETILLPISLLNVHLINQYDGMTEILKIIVK